MPQCKILLIGFSNYRQYLWNPAETVAERLNGETIEGCTIFSHVLPVKLTSVKNTVPKLLKEIDPAVALGIGLSPGAKTLLLELTAVNYIYYETSDEEGYTTHGEPIDPNGPKTLYTTLPVQQIIQKCHIEKQYPIKPSITIGTYLCNTLAYTILKWAHNKQRPGGFIHIPPDTNLAQKLNLNNYISINEIIQTIKCTLKTTLKTVFLNN